MDRQEMLGFLVNRINISLIAVLILVTSAAPIVNAETAESSYATVLSLNALMPGYGQIIHNRRAEALAALCSLQLLGVGQALYWSTVIDSDELSEPLRPDQEARFWAGRSLSLLGLGLWGASQWTAHRDELSGGHDAEAGIGLLFASPFDPAIMLDGFVLAPLLAISAARLISLPPMIFQDYMDSDSRYLLGYYWRPAGALAIRALSAGFAALGGAVAAESLIHGLTQERSGPAAALAVQAGISISPYLLLGRETLNSTIAGNDNTLISDMLFSAYAGAISEKTGNPRRAIALRFWLETILSTLRYIETIVTDPNGPIEGIGIGLKISY